MRIDRAGLPGVYLIGNDRFTDERGLFVKVFAEAAFTDAGLRTDFRESFFSESVAGVVRGMHFQVPPHEHAKLVTPVSGRIVDVVVDLRSDSPTFGRHLGLELDAAASVSVYIPAGFAHGFTPLGDRATVLYHVTSAHSARHDLGIRWDSFGYTWPLDDPLVSDRDRAFPALADFPSPFLSAGPGREHP